MINGLYTYDEVADAGLINNNKPNENQTIDGVTIYRLQKSKVKGLAWYYNSKAINEKIKNIHNLDLIDIVEASELGLAFINKKPRRGGGRRKYEFYYQGFGVRNIGFSRCGYPGRCPS